MPVPGPTGRVAGVGASPQNGAMRRLFPELPLPLMAWLCLVLCCASAQLHAASGPQILILNSYDEDTAPYFGVRETFRQELQRRYEKPLALRQYDLDARYTNEDSQNELKAQLLRSMYDQSPPDLVVALGPPAIDFWLSRRDSIAPQAPLIAMAGDFNLEGKPFRDSDAVVATRFSFAASIDEILALRPETSQVMMVFGSSTFERYLAGLAKTELHPYTDRLAFEYTNELTLAQLRQRLAELPPAAAVFFGIFGSDADGIRIDSYSGLSYVRSASKVPVFGPFEDLVGRGVVGGRLMQVERLGYEMARTAEDILRAGSLEQRRKVIDLSEPVYDWRELQAWDISLDRLPGGSRILFRPPTFWDQYRGLVVLITLAFLLQSTLVGALVLQGRKRRRAERASLRLSRKLITAFEDERRLIARELHDDLSQRLARAAIDASYVGLGNLGAADHEAISRLHPELVRISQDVHDMSYRLHPSLVDDLGISAALQAECERARRRTKAAIHENIAEVRKQIPQETALCAYRIAQEALNNAIKYSGADAIEVTLQKEPLELTLTVRDNGVGFKLDENAEITGLGLSSMRERAELVGGSLTIRSAAGQGTSVTAHLPLRFDKP